MAGNEFRYGQLIWAHFDFPDDEGDKEHPAIILQDQGDKLAVISGTSVSPNSYQSPHSYEFSHYWLFPNNLPHMKNGLTLTTFFELGVVRLVNKEKVSRISEILDKESLAKLGERTFIRAWFSDSESSKKKLKFGQVICCKKTDGYPDLDNIFPAVFICKMKNRRLKILKMKNNKSGNYITLDVQEIVSDIDCREFSSEPIIIESDLMIFSYGILGDDDLDSIKELPHIKAKSMKNKFDPTQEKYRVGDILCANDDDSSSIEIPMLVLCEYDEKLLYVIKGENTRNSSRDPYTPSKLPGFAKKKSFHFKDTAIPLSKKDIKYKIKAANDKFSRILSEHRKVKRLAKISQI